MDEAAQAKCLQETREELGKRESSLVEGSGLQARQMWPNAVLHESELHPKHFPCLVALNSTVFRRALPHSWSSSSSEIWLPFKPSVPPQDKQDPPL